MIFCFTTSRSAPLLRLSETLLLEQERELERDKLSLVIFSLQSASDDDHKEH